MAGVRARGEEIRRFILDNAKKHPTDLANLTAQNFGISRQAAIKHLKKLAEQGYLQVSGSTRDRRYGPGQRLEWEKTYQLDGHLEEDAVWRKDIRGLLGDLPKNVLAIWQYGFTEMLNNAIDHSTGNSVEIQVHKSADSIEMIIYDDGEGIFRKIQRELRLDDEHHAVLEIAKGKLTTDPDRHSGEGIFFSSRVFDEFIISSRGLMFSHRHGINLDFIIENDVIDGTVVIMTLSNNSDRVLKNVFDSYSSGDNFDFTKTVVPVRMAKYGDELLVSRSQAKRLMARLDRFQVVMLDFEEVETIGQAFADEVFRVFRNQHPEVKVIPTGMNDEVKRMIQRAENPNGKHGP